MLASLPPELIIKIANISLVGANAIVTDDDDDGDCRYGSVKALRLTCRGLSQCLRHMIFHSVTLAFIKSTVAPSYALKAKFLVQSRIEGDAVLDLVKKLKLVVRRDDHDDDSPETFGPDSETELAQVLEVIGSLKNAVDVALYDFAFHSKSELMSRLFEQVMLLPCIKHLTLSEWGKKIFNLFRTHPGWAFPVLEKLDLRSLSCLSHGDQRDLMEFQEMIGLIAKGSPSLSTLFIEVRMEGPELDKAERGS
ncbi:hypothetical protein CC2G_002101 [Coprinopsis cinerea AmutBmut pab1-1]|nr:hypothetical protein CC2G_002101 [Coprinopsis cinerea AmutBmut pab1-1]